MTTRNKDEKTIIYLVNRKIAMNMKLVKLYGNKAEYSDFQKKSCSLKMIKWDESDSCS